MSPALQRQAAPKIEKPARFLVKLCRDARGPLPPRAQQQKQRPRKRECSASTPPWGSPRFGTATPTITARAAAPGAPPAGPHVSGLYRRVSWSRSSCIGSVCRGRPGAVAGPAPRSPRCAGLPTSARLAGEARKSTRGSRVRKGLGWPAQLARLQQPFLPVSRGAHRRQLLVVDTFQGTGAVADTLPTPPPPFMSQQGLRQ